ncbi:centriole, cilia and spindle-associated protein isoform X2 [Eleginops maclovinus]|uniref:centriole, cilia and spindle-associated protein isoform X2 n=1 Tax=Eleginops maclovinus TaxID=56733 RepID=UPI0030802298
MKSGDNNQTEEVKGTMVTKKVRTEYMKKFRDPKWETFSKCYEDSVKYRVTRRVMEGSHKSWFWDGWDNSSESSGWSTPRLSRNRIAPLSLPKQKLSNPGTKQPSEDRETEGGGGETVVDAAPLAVVVENGVNGDSGDSVTPDTSGPSEVDSPTDNGPVDTTSSDGEPVKPVPKRRHRRRTPRPETPHRDSSLDETTAVVKKPPRAKSTPAISTKECRRASSRLDWPERPAEVRRTRNDSHTSDACVQTTRRGSDKRSSNPERRRARSADLEKTRRSQLTVADDRWMTEYMRCFSARLR